MHLCAERTNHMPRMLHRTGNHKTPITQYPHAFKLCQQEHRRGRSQRVASRPGLAGTPGPSIATLGIAVGDGCRNAHASPALRSPDGGFLRGSTHLKSDGTVQLRVRGGVTPNQLEGARSRSPNSNDNLSYFYYFN